jgi:hypothetical protein
MNGDPGYALQTLDGADRSGISWLYVRHYELDSRRSGMSQSRTLLQPSNGFSERSDIV